MDKYGIVLDGVVIERFENKDEWETHFHNAIREGSATGFRKLRFNELLEDEKLQIMKDKLEKLNKFLEDMKGSGRTYTSNTSIEFEELRWLVENIEKNFN